MIFDLDVMLRDKWESLGILSLSLSYLLKVTIPNSIFTM